MLEVHFFWQEISMGLREHAVDESPTMTLFKTVEKKLKNTKKKYKITKSQKNYKSIEIIIQRNRIKITVLKFIVL